MTEDERIEIAERRAFWQKIKSSCNIERADYERIAMHFAAWQKKKDIDNTKLQEAYKKGYDYGYRKGLNALNYRTAKRIKKWIMENFEVSATVEQDFDELFSERNIDYEAMSKI